MSQLRDRALRAHPDSQNCGIKWLAGGQIGHSVHETP